MYFFVLVLVFCFGAGACIPLVCVMIVSLVSQTHVHTTTRCVHTGAGVCNVVFNLFVLSAVLVSVFFVLVLVFCFATGAYMPLVCI